MDFHMTEGQLEKLVDASKPTLCIKIGTYIPTTPQENANRAWARLGVELGFDPMTVKPILGKSDRHFTAEPTLA